MKRTSITLTALLLTASCALTGCGDMDMNSATTAENFYQAEYSYADESGDAESDAPGFNTEEYSAITENSFKSTLADPLSTFSADVDTASYTNIRRMINQQTPIPADAVRIEEMINYFHYDYPEPNGDEPFSVTTEIAECPWNSDTKLLMIGLKAMDIDLSQRKPMNLVFLIDVSGSMYSADKLPLVQKAFSVLTEALSPADKISIVTYASGDRVLLEGADGSDCIQIQDAINSLEAGGSTAGAAGISTAYEIAEKYYIEGGNNRIILATDGDLNVGVSSEAELKKLVEKKRKSGVYLSVLGFGTGNIKDNKMETLADNGNGSYAYIDSELEARKVLVEEMGGTLLTVAKDVKLQVEFNPAYIKGYRLIGYENRALAAEDFSDDTKDAGEIGAGHTVTALYEIADLESKMEFDSADLKYSDTAAMGSANGEYLTVSIRYKDPDASESKLCTYPVTVDAASAEMSDDLRFASAVAAFGMLLRESAYKGNASKALILDLASRCDLANDKYKAEFVELVNAAEIS